MYISLSYIPCIQCLSSRVLCHFSFVRPSVGMLVCQKAINIRFFHQIKARGIRSSELKVRAECLMMRSRLSKSWSVCTSVHPTINPSFHSSLTFRKKKQEKSRFFIEWSKGHGKSIDMCLLFYLSVPPYVSLSVHLPR